MDKILVTIYVPSIDKEYDLFIPIKFQISEVLNSIQDSIVDLSNGAYKKKDKRIYYLMLVIARTGIRVSEVKFITVGAIKDGKAMVDNKGKVINRINNGMNVSMQTLYGNSNNVIFIDTKKYNIHAYFTWHIHVYML